MPPDDQGDNTVLGFSIDGNGNLTPLAGSPFPAGAGAINLTFLPWITRANSFMRRIMTEEAGASNLSGFRVDANSGALNANCRFSVSSRIGARCHHDWSLALFRGLGFFSGPPESVG
jgi:hypothetical protein